MKTPKVTVITVCRNASDIIEDTILSVLNQDYKNLEYIVIDGASTDSTMSIVNQYKHRITRIVSEPDKGIYDAMNKGLSMVNNSWINFMNAGDTFCNNHIITDLFDRFEDHGEKVLYGDSKIITTWGDYIISPLPIEQLRHTMVFYHQSAFVFKEYDKLLFDTKFKLCADYNMFYKLYDQGVKFCYVPICVSNYDISIDSVSYKNKKRLLEERILISKGCLSVWSKSFVTLYVTKHKIENLIFSKTLLDNKLIASLQRNVYVKKINIK